jgi:hypothetical protein
MAPAEQVATRAKKQKNWEEEGGVKEVVPERGGARICVLVPGEPL